MIRRDFKELAGSNRFVVKVKKVCYKLLMIFRVVVGLIFSVKSWRLAFRFLE